MYVANCSTGVGSDHNMVPVEINDKLDTVQETAENLTTII